MPRQTRGWLTGSRRRQSSLARTPERLASVPVDECAGLASTLGTVLRAAQIATDRREACLREKRSLAFETVFSASDKPEFVRRALAAGYFVRIFFVGTERPEINAARVARRVLQAQRGLYRDIIGVERARSLNGDPL